MQSHDASLLTRYTPTNPENPASQLSSRPAQHNPKASSVSTPKPCHTQRRYTLAGPRRIHGWVLRATAATAAAASSRCCARGVYCARRLSLRDWPLAGAVVCVFLTAACAFSCSKGYTCTCSRVRGGGWWCEQAKFSLCLLIGVHVHLQSNTMDGACWRCAVLGWRCCAVVVMPANTHLSTPDFVMMTFPSNTPLPHTDSRPPPFTQTAAPSPRPPNCRSPGCALASCCTRQCRPPWRRW